MRNAEKYGNWASIAVGLVPGGVAAGIALALSTSTVGKREVEKAYWWDKRLKVTYTYGVTMSLNTTTFKVAD